jgi:hypothetical protein
VTSPDPGAVVSTSAKKGAMICWPVLVRSNGVNSASGASKVTLPLLLTKRPVNLRPK